MASGKRKADDLSDDDDSIDEQALRQLDRRLNRKKKKESDDDADEPILPEELLSADELLTRMITPIEKLSEDQVSHQLTGVLDEDGEITRAEWIRILGSAALGDDAEDALDMCFNKINHRVDRFTVPVGAVKTLLHPEQPMGEECMSLSVALSYNHALCLTNQARRTEPMFPFPIIVRCSRIGDKWQSDDTTAFRRFAEDYVQVPVLVLFRGAGTAIVMATHKHSGTAFCCGGPVDERVWMDMINSALGTRMQRLTLTYLWDDHNDTDRLLVWFNLLVTGKSMQGTGSTDVEPVLLTRVKGLTPAQLAEFRLNLAFCTVTEGASPMDIHISSKMTNEKMPTIQFDRHLKRAILAQA